MHDLLAVAKASSRWHSERVIDVDLEGLEINDVSELPVMTKDDLMSHWDDIVTDPTITLARAEQHLEMLKDGNAYLDDAHHVVASGGSSGRRGVFVDRIERQVSGKLKRFVAL